MDVKKIDILSDAMTQEMLETTAIGDLTKRDLDEETLCFVLSVLYHYTSQTSDLYKESARWARERGRPAYIVDYLEHHAAEEEGHHLLALQDILSRRGGGGARGPSPESPAVAMFKQIERALCRCHSDLSVLGLERMLERPAVTIGPAIVRHLKEMGYSDCVRFLETHSVLDQEHQKTSGEILETIEDSQDEASILFAARLVAMTYPPVFRRK